MCVDPNLLDLAVARLQLVSGQPKVKKSTMLCNLQRTLGGHETK
jgi:hypothetical protein